MLLSLITLLVCILSFDSVSAIPPSINIIGTDPLKKIFGLLTMDEALNHCQVSQQFKKNCISSIKQRFTVPTWHSKGRISRNIEELMNLKVHPLLLVVDPQETP
jgi:hypothetical protein